MPHIQILSALSNRQNEAPVCATDYPQAFATLHLIRVCFCNRGAPGCSIFCPLISAPHASFPDSFSFREKCNVAIKPYSFCVSWKRERSLYFHRMAAVTEPHKTADFKAFCSFVYASVEDCNVAFVLFRIFYYKWSVRALWQKLQNLTEQRTFKASHLFVFHPWRIATLHSFVFCLYKKRTPGIRFCNRDGCNHSHPFPLPALQYSYEDTNTTCQKDSEKL